MFSRTISFLLIASIFCVSLAIPAFGQTNQQKQTEKVKSKIKKLGLGERVKVKIKLYNDSSHQGYVSQANDDDFVVVDKTGNSTTIKYSDVKSVGGKNFSTGAKIAIGIGIGVGGTNLALALFFASLNV